MGFGSSLKAGFKTTYIKGSASFKKPTGKNLRKSSAAVFKKTTGTKAKFAPKTIVKKRKTRRKKRKRR